MSADILATLEARYDALQDSITRATDRGHLRKADRATHRAAGIAEAIAIVRVNSTADLLTKQDVIDRLGVGR